MNEIKQKEIEEMEALILKTSEEYYRTKCCKECADFEAMALYKAGYRKQSDTVKEFADRLKNKLTDDSGWVTYKCQDLCYDIDKLAEQFGKEE